MPTPPEKRPDRHYDFRLTNVVFAWSSLALLLITIWMVAADYAKPWKRLQAEFRDLERDALLAEAEAERQRINDTELAAIQAEVDEETASLGTQQAEVAELEDRIAELERDVYAADAASRTTKSLLDTARYLFDSAVQDGSPEEQDATRAEADRLGAQHREDRKTLEELIGRRDAAAAELAAKRAGLVEAERRLAALRTGVDSIQQRLASVDKKIDYFLLNAPLMDFVAPALKVEQVMLPGLFYDINFTDVDRVDRCVTCHVASNRGGFEGEEWEEPFRSHPRLDLFVGAASPHPYSEFGCSICHGGLDRATDFARAGHSPVDEEQKARWIEDWDWEPQKYLDTPIYPANYSEAGCVTCHAADVWTPESDLQDAGRELISRMGCFGCHQIDYPAFTGLPRPGPSLRKIASKTNRGWTAKWIESPRDFHPTTWMPHFFFQENMQSELNAKRQRAEIAALVDYLWDNSEVVDYPPPPPGDVGRGEVLFESVGCTGCHIRDGEAVRDDFFPEVNRLHGPNLVRTGSKVDPGWLYAWVRDPKAYFPDTRMPSLRLTDQEAADVVAYLMDSRDDAWEELGEPAFDAEVRDEMVLSYLQNNLTIEASQASLEAMDEAERQVYLGKETVTRYGCYGCHDLEGFDGAKPIGVELTEEGSKPLHQFDFGHVHDVEHTRHDWVKTKLLTPRVWDHGKEPVKNYQELLKMPNFGMSDREAEAVAANILGFTKESAVAVRRAGRSPRAAAVADGRKVLTSFNCRGCHLIEGKGRAIRSAIEDPGLLPPNLAAQGARVQADWLFEFLHDPGSVTLRPWLSVRMPTFGFDDEQVNSLVAHFAARDERDSFMSPLERPSERDLAVGSVAFSMFQCAKCHPAGPATSAAGASTAELAPSLLLARERLRHDWVASWIKDPQSWITGTNMPANFPQLESGEFQSPLAQAIEAPMFSAERRRLAQYFASDEEMKAHLGDADEVTEALRDHIWFGLR